MKSLALQRNRTLLSYRFNQDIPLLLFAPNKARRGLLTSQLEDGKLTFFIKVFFFQSWLSIPSTIQYFYYFLYFKSFASPLLSFTSISFHFHLISIPLFILVHSFSVVAISSNHKSTMYRSHSHREPCYPGTSFFIPFTSTHFFFFLTFFQIGFQTKNKNIHSTQYGM